jgi:hypothetical protein
MGKNTTIMGLRRATDLGIGYGGASTDLLFERFRSEGFLVQALDAQTLPSSSARVLIPAGAGAGRAGGLLPTAIHEPARGGSTQ